MEFLCSGALTVTKTHRERKRNREIDKNTRNVHAYELEITKEWKLAYKLQVICTWQKLSRTKSNNPPTMLLRYIHRILFFIFLSFSPKHWDQFTADATLIQNSFFFISLNHIFCLLSLNSKEALCVRSQCQQTLNYLSHNESNDAVEIWLTNEQITRQT